MKFKLRKKIHQILNSKSIELLYIIVILLTFYLVDTYILKKRFSLGNYFELKLATSLSLTYLMAIVFKAVANNIERKIEDGLKVTNDYSSIIKMYSKNREQMLHDKGVVYPIIFEYLHEPLNTISIDDNPSKKYVVPDIVMNNTPSIFSAHKNSKIYNAKNIRLDDIIVTGNSVKMITSRTDYFSSLMTNRAIDHKFSGILSVRSLYEYDDRISPLRESALSNHIGINGLVITSDDKVVFIKRFGNVSIAKNTIGASVGASLKTKYCLDPETDCFTLAGLEKSIKSEIYDELGINDSDLNFSLDKSIVGIYRDLVEGGKPQIVFVCSTKMSSYDIHQNYKSHCKDKNKSKNLIIDGKEIFLVDRSTITESLISFNGVRLVIKRNGIKMKYGTYDTVPSVSASIVMALSHFEKHWIE